MRIKPRRGAQYHCSRCFRLAVGSCDRSSRGHPGSDAITHGARTRMQFQRRRPFPIDGFDCETAAWEQRGAQWKRRFSIGFMHNLPGLVPEAAVGRVAGMTQDVGGRVGLRGAPGASRGDLVDAFLCFSPRENAFRERYRASRSRKTARRHGNVPFSLGEKHKRRLRKNH